MCNAAITETATGINVSEAAAAKISELLAEQDNPRVFLRVYVTGGGCSGLQYGFGFDEDAADDDLRIERTGAVVVVDSMSMQYLLGADIDFEDSLGGARFVIRNPNAQSTCGCGSSFAAA